MMNNRITRIIANTVGLAAVAAMGITVYQLGTSPAKENTSEEPSDTIELTGKQQYNSRGISVQTLCESCYSLRIELHRKRVQRPVAQLGMRYSGEQL